MACHLIFSAPYGFSLSQEPTYKFQDQGCNLTFRFFSTLELTADER